MVGDVAVVGVVIAVVTLSLSLSLIVIESQVEKAWKTTSHPADHVIGYLSLSLW